MADLTVTSRHQIQQTRRAHKGGRSGNAGALHGWKGIEPLGWHPDDVDHGAHCRHTGATGRLRAMMAPVPREEYRCESGAVPPL